MLTNMLVCVMVLHMGSEMCLIVELFATDFTWNIFGFQVDYLNMSFQVGLQMKLSFAAYNFTCKPRGSMQTHMFLENAIQFESLATLFTSMRPLYFLICWIFLGENKLLGTFITIFVASLHLDFDGHLLEFFFILDVFLLVGGV